MEDDGGGREEEGGGGCGTKDKNPTQRCGKKICLTRPYVFSDHERLFFLFSLTLKITILTPYHLLDRAHVGEAPRKGPLQSLPNCHTPSSFCSVHRHLSA